MLYIPDTGMVFTSVITPNTYHYCCGLAATAADDGDGTLYWCCSIFTVAAAAPGAPAAALYRWSATKFTLSCLWNFISDELVIQNRL